MNTEFVQGWYFDHLKKSMVRKSFAFMSMVTIDHTERPYHVPADKARSTNFFFHIRGRSILVHLEYHEHAYPGEELRGYWTIKLYVQLLPYRQILETCPGIIDQDGLWGNVPVLGTGTLYSPGFRVTSSGHLGGERSENGCLLHIEFEQETTHITPLPIANLTDVVECMGEAFERYAGRGIFRKLSLSGFAPTYCFSGDNTGYRLDRSEALDRTERLFWSRFDWDYAKHFILQPYGARLFRSKSF